MPAAKLEKKKRKTTAATNQLRSFYHWQKMSGRTPLIGGTRADASSHAGNAPERPFPHARGDTNQRAGKSVETLHGLSQAPLVH
eukprot:2915453-Prorocentrum_lima.AAC.1